MIFDSNLTKDNALCCLGPIFGDGRLNRVWVVRSTDLRMQSPVYGRHSVGRAGCVTVSNTHMVPFVGRGWSREALPLPRLTPPPHPSPMVKRFSVPTVRHRVESIRIHPKMGSTARSSRTGWQRVSPLTIPFARAKPKVRPS